MKGKGFADVTEGVNSVQGSTLVRRGSCCGSAEVELEKSWGFDDASQFSTSTLAAP